jgi:hypothetical protein
LIQCGYYGEEEMLLLPGTESIYRLSYPGLGREKIRKGILRRMNYEYKVNGESRKEVRRGGRKLSGL